MTSQSFQLVMRSGPTPGKVYELSQNELFIGRDKSNAITVNDAEVSRRHARLALQGGSYVIEDLGSTNGTFVNGQRITGPISLQPGVTIRLGENVNFSYEMAGYDPSATVASGAGPAERTASPPPPARQAAPARPASPGYAGQVPASPAAAAEGQGLLANRPLVIGCAALLVVGLCVALGGLWYIDANFLWCDVFGGLIPACP